VIRPTRIPLLIALLALAAAIGWALGSVISGQTGRVIPVPWFAPLTMWMLSLGLLIWTLLSRPRLLRRPGAQPMPALVAARTAALALAASRTGVIVGGLYAGIALALLPNRETPSGSAALWAAGATTLGSIALVVIALWLERVCQLPDHGDDSSNAVVS
jgi:hypothetical protein